MINSGWAVFVDNMSDGRVIIEEYEVELTCDSCGRQVIVDRRKYMQVRSEGGPICAECSQQGYRSPMTAVKI